MKMCLTIAALVLTIAPLAARSTDSGGSSRLAGRAQGGGVEETLMRVERDTLAAILKRDGAAAGAVLADDFVATLPSGDVQTKAQFLADLKSGDLVIESSEMADMKVRVYGDAAVVTYSSTDKGKYKGQDIGGRYRWTDTFVRRANKWQIVATQGTPIPNPRP